MLLRLVSLALLTVYFRESSGGSLHGLQSTGSSVLRPFEVAANRVAQPFRDAAGWLGGLSSARSENKKLRQKLADALRPGDHGSTFAGGPLIASAALAALEICSDPQLLEQVQAKGKRLADGLARLPFTASVRGRGLMLAIDVVDGVSASKLVRRALIKTPPCAIR